MFLSIIIPVHNVENYIRDCINSVLDQDCKDYEIILIENASTDNSLNICKEYANIPNISIFSIQNPGVSHARNLGIQKAVGQYIWFVDSDDIILKNSVSYLKEKIKFFSNPDVLIFAHNEIINGIPTKAYCYPYEKYIDKVTAINGLFDSTLWNGFICNKLIKNNNQILKENLFLENIHMIEDLAFFTKLFKKYKTFAVTNKCLYSYRKRTGSISNIFNEKKLSAFTAYEIIIHELENSKDYKFAKKIIGNAKVDFSRQILTHYFLNDRNSYKMQKNKYKKVILKNFKYITNFKAKIAALLTFISPNILEKMRSFYEK